MKHWEKSLPQARILTLKSEFGFHSVYHWFMREMEGWVCKARGGRSFEILLLELQILVWSPNIKLELLFKACLFLDFYISLIKSQSITNQHGMHSILMLSSLIIYLFIQSHCVSLWWNSRDTIFALVELTVLGIGKSIIDETCILYFSTIERLTDSWIKDKVSLTGMWCLLVSIFMNVY